MRWVNTRGPLPEGESVFPLQWLCPAARGTVATRARRRNPVCHHARDGPGRVAGLGARVHSTRVQSCSFFPVAAEFDANP